MEVCKSLSWLLEDVPMTVVSLGIKLHTMQQDVACLLRQLLSLAKKKRRGDVNCCTCCLTASAGTPCLNEDMGLCHYLCNYTVGGLCLEAGFSGSCWPWQAPGVARLQELLFLLTLTLNQHHVHR